MALSEGDINDMGNRDDKMLKAPSLLDPNNLPALDKKPMMERMDQHFKDEMQRIKLEKSE